MYLSNRLTFSIFSLLLVAALVFVATPAMAITEVTAQVTDIVGNDSSATPVVQGKKVVTIKYSENADPAPVITGPDNTNTPDDDDSDPDVLAVTKVDGKTYTLTFLGADDGTSAAVIPALTLTGYQELTGLDGHTIDTADPTNSTNIVTPFVLNANTLAGKGFAIVATYRVNDGEGNTGALISSSTGAAVDVSTSTTGSFPTLPTQISSGEAIVRRDWNDHFNAASVTATPDEMPDLWAHFQQGHRGTLDLTVVTGDGEPIDGTIDGTNSAFSTTRVGDVNARTVVINEVMWGRDESQVGGIGHTREQWIEIYNTKTTPVPFENIQFTLSNAHPAPTNASTDRLSTYPNFSTVWDITGKGQDGHPGAADGSGRKEFRSMHRTNHANGWTAGHWAEAGPLYLPNFRGTPGMANSFSNLPGPRPVPTAANVPKDNIIINEVGNYAGTDDDWIELRNVSTGEVNIKGWRLNRTTGEAGNYDEHNIIDFPKDTKIGAGEVLLIVNKDPADSKLAAGMDIRESDRANQQFGAGPHKYLNIKRSDGKTLDIPNMDQGFLILRSHGDNKFRGGRQHIRDVVGYSRVSRDTTNDAAETKEPEVGQFWKTDAWPLNGHSGNNYRAHDAKDSNNNNASLHPDADFREGNVWARSGTNHGWRKGGGGHVGYVGGIGYDRGVEGNGTPGYHNDIVKGKTGDLADGALIISELMLTTDGGRYPQWIELHNTSRTRGIDLASDGSDPKTGWQITIENHNSGSWLANNRPLVATINLKDLIRYIPPNQTVLIVSRDGRHKQDQDKAGLFPSHRVASIWGTPNARKALAPKNSKDAMLNAAGGFYIKIVDGDGNVSDEIGNLDGKAASVRENIPLDSPDKWKTWSWPNEMTDNDERTSLIRIMDGGTRGVQGVSDGTAGTPRAGTPKRDANADTREYDGAYVVGDMTGMVLPMGIANNRRGNGMVGVGMMDADGNTVMVPAKYAGAAWIHADDTALADAQDTWYGSNNDIGTPLHTAGTPLPVNLSFFRPTLEDGKVVIRWTTESELDNAGFNILRSDTRNGEFKQVNAQLIQGKGTTAERSTYKWVDTTAKPGAVYYYQIEDVSFAGERSTLTTTKLKGLISAKGKLTTKWGELKEVQ